MGRIRRLYRMNALGVYDDELLAEVGWGLHARCNDVLVVHRAMRGEVPCPSCGEMVQREVYRSGSSGNTNRSELPFACPHCNNQVSWRECRDDLRNGPRCFDCLILLDRGAALNVCAAAGVSLSISLLAI